MPINYLQIVNRSIFTFLYLNFLERGAPIPKNALTADIAAKQLGANLTAMSLNSGPPPVGGVRIFPPPPFKWIEIWLNHNLIQSLCCTPKACNSPKRKKFVTACVPFNLYYIPNNKHTIFLCGQNTRNLILIHSLDICFATWAHKYTKFLQKTHFMMMMMV